MGKKIVTFVLTLICASVAMQPLRGEPEMTMASSVDEIRDWKSWDEVMRSSLRLFDVEAHKKGGAMKLLVAVQSGLRSIEYSRELDIGKNGASQKTTEQLDRLITRGRSIREIAVLGHLMVLAETRHAEELSKGQIQNSAARGLVEELDERREQSLKALSVLLSGGTEVVPNQRGGTDN